MGAALAIAKDTSGVRSGGGADKASVAAPKAFESRAYGGAGGAGAKATAWRGPGRSRRTSGKGRASAHRVEKDATEQRELTRLGLQRGTGKECDQAKGTHLRRPQREDTSVHGKERPHEGHSRAGDSRAREGMPNVSVWGYWK